MRRYVHEENILLHRKLLAETTDKEKRKIILRQQSTRRCQLVISRRNQVHSRHGIDPAKVIVNFLHTSDIFCDNGSPS